MRISIILVEQMVVELVVEDIKEALEHHGDDLMDDSNDEDDDSDNAVEMVMSNTVENNFPPTHLSSTSQQQYSLMSLLHRFLHTNHPFLVNFSVLVSTMGC